MMGSSAGVRAGENVKRNKNEKPIQIDLVNLDQTLGSLMPGGFYCNLNTIESGKRFSRLQSF